MVHCLNHLNRRDASGSEHNRGLSPLRLSRLCMARPCLTETREKMADNMDTEDGPEAVAVDTQLAQRLEDELTVDGSDYDKHLQVLPASATFFHSVDTFDSAASFRLWHRVATGTV